MNNRIHELRLARGLSQAALADELQVSRQTINAIEAGRSDPSLALAFAIARLFGTRIDKVFQDQAASL
ncbi:MAG: helix-turn-helix transcriptional regulator [Pseudomonadota bacterium]